MKVIIHNKLIKQFTKIYTRGDYANISKIITGDNSKRLHVKRVLNAKCGDVTTVNSIKRYYKKKLINSRLNISTRVKSSTPKNNHATGKAAGSSVTKKMATTKQTNRTTNIKKAI